MKSGEAIVLHSGERVRLTRGVYHEFFPESDECIIGEVSTANDDLHDNYFVSPEVGRYPGKRKTNPRWSAWSAKKPRTNSLLK